MSIFQRFDLAVFCQRGHGDAAVVANPVTIYGDIHFGLRLYRQAAQGRAVTLPDGIVVQCGAVLIQEEVHYVAIFYSRLSNRVARVALFAGGITVILQHTVVGRFAVDRETAVAGRLAEQLGDKTTVADSQKFIDSFLGEGILKCDLMCLDQGVQRGHAVRYLIGEAIAFRQVGSDLNGLRKAVEIDALRLGADGDRGGGDNGSRRLAALHQQMNSVVGGHNGGDRIAAGFLCVAAANVQRRAADSGNRRCAAIAGVTHSQIDLILLIGRRGTGGESLCAFGQRQGVLGGTLIKSGGQRTGAEGQRGQAGIGHVIEITADILAAVAGIHDADLIACPQGAIADCVIAEARVGEPVVQRTHPAGTGTAVEFVQSGDSGDVLAAIAAVFDVCGKTSLFNGGLDAGHHGGIGIKGDVSIHLPACPRRRFSTCCGFREHGVFHDHMNSTEVLGRSVLCEHGGGYQAQYHHQCHQQRDNAFSHV